MKLIWISDIHLNFLNKPSRQEFYEKIGQASTEQSCVVITGDIAESHLIVDKIKEMHQVISVPVYFVLGNHDYYGSSVSSTKRSVKHLGYIGGKQIVDLTSSVALVGVDGWGDCRNGDYENSRLTMSDWIYIDDLRGPYGLRCYVEGDPLKDKLQELADKDAASLKTKVKKAIKAGYKKIIIATHVPPFEEVCLNAGRKSTPDGLPFFSSKCLGDAILPIARQHAEVDFLWLSGHTHSRARYKPCANMVCKVAKAEYYFPQIEEIINV